MSNIDFINKNSQILFICNKHEFDLESVIDDLTGRLSYFVSVILVNTDECVDEVNKIIKEYSYNHIIFAGKNISKMFLPSLFSNNKSFYSVIKGSPYYTLEYGNNCLCTICFDPITTNKDTLPEWLDNVSTSVLNGVVKNKYNLTVKMITDDDEFIKILKKIDKQKGVIGYDIETNQLAAFTKDSYCTIVGLSISNNKTDAECYWYLNTNRNRFNKKVLNALMYFFKRNYKRTWCFNGTMEIKWSNFLLNNFFEFEDARVLMAMYGIGGSLKDIVKNELKVPAWEVGVKEYVTSMDTIFKYVKNVVCKKDATPTQLLKEGKLDEFIETITSKSHKAKFLGYIDALKDELSDEEISESLSHYPFGWAAVPKKLLGYYCAEDAGYTALLVNNYYTDEIKKPYNVYIKHPWLGSKFEINGVPWDDGQAEKVLDDSYEKMLDCLYNLIQLCDITVSEGLLSKEIRYSELPFTVILKKKAGDKYKDAVTLIECNKDRINALKSILNVASSAQSNKDKFWNNYNNDDLKIAGMLIYFFESLELIPGMVEKLNKILLDKGINQLNFKEIFSFILNNKNKFEDKSLKKAITKSISIASNKLENVFGKFDEDTVKFQYQILTRYFGVDTSDENTWNTQYKMLFYLFYYKKLAKMTNDIYKKIGRDNLWYSKIYKGIPYRCNHYYDTEVTDNIRNNDVLVLENSFNVMGTNTTRWNAAWHGSPQNSPMRRCYTTFNKRQVWVHADYSQAELVMLAVMCGDEGMINAFKQGKDLHRFTASIAFNVEYDKVTPDLRKAAKAINFGIVYGKSIQNIAIEITHGDVPKAQAIYDTILDSFPKIRDFIFNKHTEVTATGQVSLYFGNKINIDMSTRGNKKLRQAVNYPIQGTSSTIAGTSMYLFIKACEKRGYPISPIGFTHDALDSLFDIDMLFETLDLMISKLQTDLREKANIPMTVDYEVGTDAFNLCHFKYNKDDLTLSISGTEDATLLLINRLKTSTTYKIYDIKQKSRNIETISWETMFTTGKALNDQWGKEIVNVDYTMKVDFI